MSDTDQTGFAARLRMLPQPAKILIVAAADLVTLTAIVFFAHVLRVSEWTFPPRISTHLYTLAPVLSCVSLAFFGVYHHAVRGYTQLLERRILLSQILAVAAWVILLLVLGTEGFARSVVGIYFALALLAVIVLRRMASWFLQQDSTAGKKKQRAPVVIFGAGREGIMLAESLSRRGPVSPKAFLDSDYTLFGRTIHGLPVRPLDELSQVMKRYRPSEVLIAKPSLSRESRRQLVNAFLAQGLKVRMLVGADGLVEGGFDGLDIRNVNVEDLLGRDPVPPDERLMKEAIGGKVVMVTGAGGSIGSEIVRQIMSFGVKKIVLFEISEFALFEIHRETEQKSLLARLPVVLTPILGDVRDSRQLSETMRDHQVEVVFHAAAYKHVRMVQDNPFAGARTNIWGSLHAAQAAIRNGVKLFVLVSTDKAVRSSNIMGATKRWAELISQSLAASPRGRTRFAIVRFGNVLGSSGSVVPLFREQIEKGGPLTVTDPDATRYFMLIPEAAQLVIQAGAMARRGEVFVLDMGEPVKILQLAKTMVELAGLSLRAPDNPDGDIEIRFTGLREGEKLHEELHLGESLTQTSNARIWRAKEYMMPASQLKRKVAALDRAINSRNAKAATALIMQVANRTS